MLRMQELLTVLVLCCAMLALVLTAPVNNIENTGERLNTAEVKDIAQSSPEDELKALSASVVKAPEHISEETVEETVENEEQRPSDGARKRSELPLDTNMLPLAEEEEQQQPDLPQNADNLFMQDSQLMADNPPLPALDLSPRTVAEYLLLTGDWQSFDQATADLLQAGILMPAEAAQYREDVAQEYENLMTEVAEAEASYLQDIADPMETSYDLPMDMDMDMPSLDSYDTMSELDVMEELRRLELEELMEKEAALDELLEAIVEDYVDRAQQDEEQEESAEAVQQQQQQQQEFLPNAHYVQVLDLMASAVEGEITTDDVIPPKETGSADAAEVKEVEVPESDEVEELESLGKLKEVQNGTGPKKAEQKLEKEPASANIEEPSA